MGSPLDSSTHESGPRPAYADWIQPTRVAGHLYTDARVFREEVERVFDGGWLFLAHESEIAEPGELVTRRLGLRPVLLTRDEHGKIHGFANRCPHRGAAVCARSRGRARILRCPYHGWSFALGGELIGVPHPDGFGPGWKREDHGLDPVPRLASYRGFLFGSWNAQVRDLVSHLGRAVEMIDRLCDLSPQGELSVRAGWLQHRVRANWKILAENVCDFYHPAPTHASSPLPGAFFDDATGAVNRALGDGHGEMDIRPALTRREPRPLDSLRGPEREHVLALARRDGEARAVRRYLAGPPHGLIFPNLFIAGQNLFVFHPMSAGETSHHQTPVFYTGAPDALRVRHLRRFEGASGPAGFLEPDDAAVWERVQRGFEAGESDWALLERGSGREVGSGSAREGRMLDETAARGFWRHYLALMTGAAARG